MPVLFMVLGSLMMAAAVLGEPKELEKYLSVDLAPGSRLYAWTGALGGVAAVGFIKPLEGVSRAFLLLTIAAVTLRESRQIIELLNTGPNIPARNETPQNAVPPREQQKPPVMKQGPVMVPNPIIDRG